MTKSFQIIKNKREKCFLLKFANIMTFKTNKIKLIINNLNIILLI